MDYRIRRELSRGDCKGLGTPIHGGPLTDDTLIHTTGVLRRRRPGRTVETHGVRVSRDVDDVIPQAETVVGPLRKGLDTQRPIHCPSVL